MDAADPIMLDDRVTGGGASPMKDCTSAVEERLHASLATDRLVRALGTGTAIDPADVTTLLHEVIDLTTRLRSATHAMVQVHSAIDDKQFYARVRDARDRLHSELEGLIGEFGGDT